MSPRVLLDATAIPVERAGVGRYVDRLAAALDQADTDLVIACQHDDAEIFADLAPHARIEALSPKLRPRARRMAWEQSGLPILVRRTKSQVLHSPHYTLPLTAGVPVVSTLHDATFFSDRELHLGVKGRFFRSWTRTALKVATLCIVPSQATADELIRWAGAPPRRILVAHHGVDHDLFHPPSRAAVRSFTDEFDVTSWIAFLGTIEPRKNVPALVRGYAAAFAQHPEPPALVLAGAAGWDHEVAPVVAQIEAPLRVLRVGHLPLESLPALLGGAQVVAYPSLGEGFGLPVLEAMACGAPVLTTDRLSLPEVGGDAVAYTDVSAEAIGKALKSLVADPVRRSRLSAAAQQRAAGFTWAATAEQHLRAYRAAARA